VIGMQFLKFTNILNSADVLWIECGRICD